MGQHELEALDPVEQRRGRRRAARRPMPASISTAASPSRSRAEQVACVPVGIQPPAPRILTVAMAGSSHRVTAMTRALPDPAFWSGRRVLVTGHTGFKGRWLDAVAARPRRRRDRLLAPRRRGRHRRRRGPRRGRREPPRGRLPPRRASPPSSTATRTRPRSTRPTWSAPPTCCRRCASPTSVRAVVAVTSDKCYLDQGAEWPYREDDRLGGYDPYSSSKAAQELVIAAFRDSIGIPVASVRAGNVIGGGDETPGRLAPRPDPRGADRRADGDPRAARAPPLAARAQPARGLSAAGRAARRRPHLRDRVQLRPRRGAAHGRVDRRARRARSGRAGSTSASPSARPSTRRRSPASTPRAPARGWAGARRGTSPPRSSRRSSGSSPAARAATCRSSRSSASGR